MKKLMNVAFIAVAAICCLYASCKKDSAKTTSTTSTTWTCDSAYAVRDTTSIVSPGLYYNIAMPTAFTPNGDGRNDLFRVLSDSLTDASFLLTIYRPNGTIIFETNNHTTGWDGYDSSGVLGTDYQYGVSLRYTNMHGVVVDTCSRVFLLHTNATLGCIIDTVADKPYYKFADMYDLATGKFDFASEEESYCY